jgi:hypothetical protein
MSPLKTSLIAALVSAALTAGCVFFLSHRRAPEAARLRHQNDEMRYQASQRRQAQMRAVAPAASSAMAEPTASPASTRASSSASNPRPVENYRNEGQATPLAALQTFAWACDRGDTETVAHMLLFDGASRKKLEAFTAALPEEARAHWKSVDEMAAAALTYTIMGHPFPNADILEAATFEQVSEDRALYRLPGSPKDRTPFQKTGGVWKYVITEEVADLYIAENTAPQPQPSAH